MNQNVTNNEIKCLKCGNVIKNTDKFCAKCGNPVNVIQKDIVKPSNFDPIFECDEDYLLEVFIKRELTKAQLDINTKQMPADIFKRKLILNIIFNVLLFVFICLIFFHFPLYTYIIGIILLIVFKRFTIKYDLMKYLIKEITSRPGEKISNIIMDTKNKLVDNDFKKIKIIGFVVAFILPLIIFIKPVILYEKMENGYGVRYYAFGLTNFKSATIPATHKDKNVVSLRGNTFSNMPLLSSVVLPDTITEIRGQAFKNDISLTSVILPVNLEYLGGGAFYNCTLIKEIVFSDSLTYLGGEAFYNAVSLTNVRLSNNLTEIRGSTFENCESLEKIDIPDNVTRIGGHAFYGNTSLKKVIISENSKLTEIGSSAFRRCDSLRNITLPSNTYVNSRAFKESPTHVTRYGSDISNCHYDVYGNYNCNY